MSSSSSSEVGVPSVTRRRRSNGRRRRRRAAVAEFDQVWPEHFIEALVVHVAIDASTSLGRLASAPAIARLFQVCSTWRVISRLESLWRTLTREIWKRSILRRESWQEEFMYGHATASNFRGGRCAHSRLSFGEEEELHCLRLALSDDHIAAGFSDGSVRLFHLQTSLHLRTFRPLLRDRLGVFSPAVSGIILPTAAPHLVFASLDGDLHVSLLLGSPRRAHLGDVLNDGTLLDFTGCNRFWVGLYAGVPGRAIHIWNGETEQLMFVGGMLTDPEAVTGWHLLTELRSESIGRVRVVGDGDLAVACTAHEALLFDLRQQGLVIAQEQPRRGIIVGSLDVSRAGACIMVDTRGVASVRRAHTMEEARRFPLRGGAHINGLLGAINGGYALMCARGVISVWDAQLGDYLYSITERVQHPTYLVASDTHVAASQNGTSIHLWDFGA